MTIESRSLVVLGATRGVGRHVAEQALAAGHAVTVLVRDPARLPFTHPRLTVVVGDATDVDAVRRAVRGQDAVVSALGAPVLSTDAVRERGAAALVQAMADEGVHRVVMLSSHGVAETYDELPWLLRWVNDAAPRGTVRHGFGAQVVEGMKIARADVATFMLAQLGSDAYLHQAPGVSW